MSLTRKMLKAMGIEEEKIDQIVEAHTETVEAIKTERDEYKEKAEKTDGLQKQLDEAQKLIDANGKDPYKVKYEAMKEEFEKYKTAEAEKATKEKKREAYKQLLKDSGVAEKRIDAIMKVTDTDGYELDENGAIKDAKKVTETIKTEWADFIQTSTPQGAKTSNPPENNGGKTLTKEQIYERDDHGRYKLSAAERQEALQSLQTN